MRRALCLCLAALLLVGLSGGARATSIIFPTFGHPHFIGNRVVVVSPDHRRLLCFSRNGTKAWERKLPADSFLLSAPRGGLLIQSGREVFDLDVRSGTLAHRFRVPHDLRILSTPAPEFLHGLTYGRFPSRLMALDEKTGRVRWSQGNIDRVLGATPSIVVAVRTDHIPAKGGGMLLTGSRLLAFDRVSGLLRWQQRTGAKPFPKMAFHASHVAYLEEPTAVLRLVDADTGQELATRKLALERGSTPAGVTMDTTGILLVVHSVAGVGISKERPHQIRAYGIPKLGRREEVEISASEVTKAYRADGGYLTDALYRTVFFSASGERIWERFQCDRTEPIDGNFYFSDYDGDARVGVVDLQTGRERILVREHIEFNYPSTPSFQSSPPARKAPMNDSAEPQRVYP